MKKTELLDWTIVARVKPGRVDFVKVAKDPSRNGTFEESVIQTVRGKALPKPRDGSPRGIIRDDTGQRALAAFRIAVREAKAS